MIRHLANHALSDLAGWQVVAAASGAEALSLAGDPDPPEAILLDVVMPDMDGPATLAQLQANPRTSAIPVILVTATTGAEAIAELESIGAAGIIAKPFDVNQLAGQVTAILAGAS